MKEEKQKYEGRIDIILHCNGGTAYATEILVYLLLNHKKGPIHVWIPYKAMSAGTIIAMAADVIHLELKAHMGPIDPQYTWGIAANDIADTDLQNSSSWLGDGMKFVQKGAKKVINDWNAMIESIAEYHGWTEDQECVVTDRLMFRASSHAKPLFLPEMTSILSHILHDPKEEEGWGLILELTKKYMNCHEKTSF